MTTADSRDVVLRGRSENQRIWGRVRRRLIIFNHRTFESKRPEQAGKVAYINGTSLLYMTLSFTTPLLCLHFISRYARLGLAQSAIWRFPLAVDIISPFDRHYPGPSPGGFPVSGYKLRAWAAPLSWVARYFTERLRNQNLRIEAGQTLSLSILYRLRHK